MNKTLPTGRCTSSNEPVASFMGALGAAGDGPTKRNMLVVAKVEFGANFAIPTC